MYVLWTFVKCLFTIGKRTCHRSLVRCLKERKQPQLIILGKKPWGLKGRIKNQTCESLDLSYSAVLIPPSLPPPSLLLGATQCHSLASASSAAYSSSVEVGPRLDYPIHRRDYANFVVLVPSLFSDLPVSKQIHGPNSQSLNQGM